MCSDVGDFGSAEGDAPFGGTSRSVQVREKGKPGESGRGSEFAEGGEDDSKLVYARGIAEGLVIRMDGSADPLTLQAYFRDFMIARSGFLKGSTVFLDWFGEKPTREVEAEVRLILKQEFAVEALDLPRRLRSKIELEGSLGGAGSGDTGGATDLGKQVDIERKGFSMKQEQGAPLSLFDGFNSSELDQDVFDGDVFADDSGAVYGREVAAPDIRTRPDLGRREVGGISNHPADFETDLAAEVLGDVADARMVFGTLRSGQRVESEHSLIVAGDVNSGAELVAGGDIFVLGKLRGVAHAGAYDETGAGRVIFALELEPTQLRIGSVITRGGSEGKAKGVPELARVDGNMIIVEPYQSRRTPVGVGRRTPAGVGRSGGLGRSGKR